jgi:hypothetical protein
MIYTTGWARLKSAEEYAAWLSGLKHKDEVLLQEFVPRGDSDSCFRSQAEGWRFTAGKIALNCGNWYFVPAIGGDDTPIKDGLATYYGGNPWGDVFQGRIAPRHHHITESMQGSTVLGHAPVYEPEWVGSRCFALAPFCPKHHDIRFALEGSGVRYYDREVREGYLLTLFGDVYTIEPLAKSAGLQWLYSEKLD